jgi:hypothetical protein
MVFGVIKSLILWVITELRVLYRVLFSPISGKTHAERLESFYSHQVYILIYRICALSMANVESWLAFFFSFRQLAMMSSERDCCMVARR